jgi:hypothetical protein
MKKDKTTTTTAMRTRTFAIAISLIFMLAWQPAKSQLIDVKPWTGSYPDMEGSYPLTFVSFKTLILPVPHVFVRTWPTHYYLEAVSLPVTDATEIAADTKTGLLRIVEKMVERSQMKGRHEETEEIKLNTKLQKEISQTLFDARSDQLEDNYQLSTGFIKLYNKIGQFDAVPNILGVKQIFEKEADELLMLFLMVNLLETGHGEKMEAFLGIHTEQNKLLGEIDYTYQKVKFYNSFDSKTSICDSYNFLTR